MANSLDEVLFEAVVNAGELPMSLAKLNGLKVGDVILQDMGRSELCVNGLPIYEVQIGSRGDNAAVKESTMAGATNGENVEEPTQPVEAEASDSLGEGPWIKTYSFYSRNAYG